MIDPGEEYDNLGNDCGTDDNGYDGGGDME